ncbi:MAG: nitroreductase family protein [Candidatus Caldarchaeum sp.]|nr:nitroreductase family protein [Candidatus Caldarchaeum sp.]MCS7129429.1 nitroreductase family protein [Candidatus Caldarchaeum sp.]
MSADAFLGFLKSRRSCKRLGAGEVPLDVALKAVEAGVWAANAHGCQPWRFVVVSDPEVREKLLEEMGKDWLRDLLGDGLTVDKAEKIVEASKNRSRLAAFLIIACLNMKDMDSYWDGRRSRFEYLMGVQSVAAAVQNMLLAIHAMGYGSCWRCSPLFAQEAVRRVLKIPDDFEPQAMVEVGLRGGETAGARRPIGEVAYLNRWGTPLC